MRLVGWEGGEGGGGDRGTTYLQALASALTPSARKKMLSRRLTYSFGTNYGRERTYMHREVIKNDSNNYVFKMLTSHRWRGSRNYILIDMQLFSRTRTSERALLN